MESTATKVKYEIFIDKSKFEVHQDEMTGAQLRSLPAPPVGENRDLFLEKPGGEDELIAAGTVVAIKDGLHFFTVPKHINPGL